jgi:hypothetical protein
MLLKRHFVGGSKPTKADFQSLCAVATTLVTSILCMGVTLLRKSPTVQGWAVRQLSHSAYGQLKDFLGLLLNSDYGFESENVKLARGVVLLG